MADSKRSPVTYTFSIADTSQKHGLLSFQHRLQGRHQGRARGHANPLFCAWPPLPQFSFTDSGSSQNV